MLEAVERDLAALGGDLAFSGLALTAKALAREIDEPGNSATSKSMCAARLGETLDRLRELAPPVREANKVDELRARRDARVGRAAS